MKNEEKAENPMTADAQLAARLFGLDGGRDVTSLCIYGPVYKMQAQGRDWVLKRTGYSRSSAVSIANWLRCLNDKDVQIISPASGFGENPRKIWDGDKFFWVVYPFISGHAYNGTAQQIENAGRLLGQIHQLGAGIGDDLLRPALIELPSLGSIEEKIADIEILIRHLPGYTPLPKRNVKKFREVAASVAIGAPLPYAACS